MKVYYRFLVILLFLPLLVGMGSILGDESPDKVPTVEDNFKAAYIDQMDIVNECREISIEGNTFLEGKRGEGTYTIPFDKIKDVIFLIHNATLTGIVHLNDGNKVELILQKDHRAYGKTQYGTFQIKLLNLKKLIFHSTN